MKDVYSDQSVDVDISTMCPTGVSSIDQLDLYPIMVKLIDQNGEN